MIYLDNSATTQIAPEVLEAMMPWLSEQYGNASSIYDLGRRARLAVEGARTEVASLINAHPAEVIFTSGGTESNNAILRSCMIESALVTSLRYGATEHHSVLDTGAWLAAAGYNSEVITTDSTGRVNIDEIEAVPARLYSIMHANNETGILQPLAELREKAASSFLHSDMVQSFGKIPVDVVDFGVDFASFSAHKIHGPKGVGAMFIKKGIDFKSHQHGGGQERNRRAGTESVANIVGFQVAARRAADTMTQNAEHMKGMCELIRQQLTAEIPEIRINTPEVGAAPHIVNVSFRDASNLDGESILQQMDMQGVAVSNGSACVSGSLQPSHVLVAMGLGREEANAAVRFSVSATTTSEEVLSAVTILSDVIRNMRVATHK